MCAPRIYSLTLANSLRDPAEPRQWAAAVTKSNLDDKVKDRIRRAESAVSNGLETIALYAAAVAATNVPGVNARTANILSLVYLATRLSYNLVYVVLQENPKWAPIRTLSWAGGIGIIMAMFSVAGAGVYWQV